MIWYTHNVATTNVLHKTISSRTTLYTRWREQWWLLACVRNGRSVAVLMKVLSLSGLGLFKQGAWNVCIIPNYDVQIAEKALFPCIIHSLTWRPDSWKKSVPLYYTHLSQNWVEVKTTKVKDGSLIIKCLVLF